MSHTVNTIHQKPNAVSFSKAIKTPPEIMHYEAEYNEMDKTLEQYLSKKYAKQINSFKFFPNDILIRFVLGYKHIGKSNTQNAANYQKRKDETERLFAKYLQFHETSDYDGITSKLSLKEIEELTPDICFYGNDKYGHPIIYDNGKRFHKDGDLSVFQNENGFDKEMVDKFIAFCLKTVHEIKIENTKRYLKSDDSVGIYQMCAVINLNGFSVTKFLSQRKMFEYMTRRATEVTPDSLHKVYLINAPWIFVKVWNIFKQFVHPITVEKTMILGDHYIDELLKDIDINMIPKEFGGEGR